MRSWTLAAFLCVACGRHGTGSAPAARALVVTKGDLAERILITGDLDAVSSDVLGVPRTPQWNLSIRWLENDGTIVTAGQKVAEFDNSAFANNLAEQKLAAVQSKNDLALQVAQNALTTGDRKFEVEKARLAVEMAKLTADVVEGTLPKRVHQENQLKLERARVALSRATDDLAAQKRSAELDIKIREISLEKAEREIRTAEAAIESVVLRAPRDGIVVLADHPWEGRKLDIGDNVWVGLPVVRLPDLHAMKVNALLSDVDDGRIGVGMSAVAYLDAYPDLPFPGTITEVSPVAREPSQRSWRRSFLVTIALERTDPQRMLPGMSARVEIQGKKVEGALVAPRTSVDVARKPPRLSLANGNSVDLGSVLCNPQSCAIQPVGDTVKEGTLLGSFQSGAQ